jgi:hypothetical protein
MQEGGGKLNGQSTFFALGFGVATASLFYFFSKEPELQVQHTNVSYTRDRNFSGCFTPTRLKAGEFGSKHGDDELFNAAANTWFQEAPKIVPSLSIPHTSNVEGKKLVIGKV